MHLGCYINEYQKSFHEHVIPVKAESNSLKQENQRGNRRYSMVTSLETLRRHAHARTHARAYASTHPRALAPTQAHTHARTQASSRTH